MRDISLHILDIAQNSIAAGASRVSVAVEEDTAPRRLLVTIGDDGRGMDALTAARATDPFYTTRKTRRVGLGLAFWKMACEMTGGGFALESQPGQGATVTAQFYTNHIDCPPLGDVEETVYALVTMNPALDFYYLRRRDGERREMDTAAFRAVLDGIPLDTPEVAQYIRAYLAEMAFPPPEQSGHGAYTKRDNDDSKA